MMRALTALAILLFASFSFAWWDPSFQYRVPINISSSFNLTDYQVQINPNIYNNTGLVGSWHFSEGSGALALDASGLGNNGTLTNGPVWAAGKFGNGLQFDGVNDYALVPDNPSFKFYENFTLLAWVKTSAAVDGIVINNLNQANGYGYMLRVNYPSAGIVFLQYHNGATSLALSATKPVNDGQWHQIVGVREKGSLAKIYVDGILNATTADPGFAMSYGTIGLEFGGSYDSRFGGFPPSTNTEPLNGTIDELRIYNRSLSAQEISDIYNASKARLDYADLRFTYYNSTSSAEAQLPFWQESDQSVWLKASLRSGSNTFYMYYGNSSAGSASNSSAIVPAGDLATSAQAISSGDYAASPPGNKAGAFDNNLVSAQGSNTQWFSANTIDASGGAVWLGQNFTGGRIIKKYNVFVDIDPGCSMSMCPVRVPYAWTFEGSNAADFSTKTILDNQTGYALSDSVWASFNISNPAQYQYYRMRITKTGTGVSNQYAFVTEMELIGFEPASPAPSVAFGAVQQDNMAPVVSIQSPLNQTYSNSATLINFTASDNVAVSSCAVRLNGVINSSSCGNYSLALSNGAYVLNVTANDATGNVNSAQVSFTVAADAIPPSVSLQSPVNVTYNSTSIPLNFTASDASGISACKSELNGANSSLPGCANTTITAANGSNSFTLWASDGSNWGSASVSFTVAPPLPPVNNTTSAVSNSTTTDSFGIGNATLNGIPSGAGRLALTVGSQTQAKAFSVSSGVNSVRIYAKVTSKGTPVPARTLSFEIS